MTDPSTILDDNWDIAITSKPEFIDDSKSNRAMFLRVISTRLTNFQHNTFGIPVPDHLDEESYDAYETWLISNTQADLENMFKAFKKVCSLYSPVIGNENILTWAGGDIVLTNGFRFELQIVWFLGKAGILAYP